MCDSLVKYKKHFSVLDAYSSLRFLILSAVFASVDRMLINNAGKVLSFSLLLTLILLVIISLFSGPC
jgi:branched-subunit amino acid permease